jgi:cell division protein FtsN
MKTLFPKLCVITSALVAMLYLGACTASEEAEQEEGAEQEAPPAAQPAAPTTMKKDTAEVKVVPPAVTEPAAPATATVLYAVQIGAYENDSNAQHAEQLIAVRFSQPVRKYFDETTKLYKVSVGSFPTKDQALEFRKLLNEKYPGEYQDAWIVEVQK